MWSSSRRDHFLYTPLLAGGAVGTTTPTCASLLEVIEELGTTDAKFIRADAHGARRRRR